MILGAVALSAVSPVYSGSIKALIVACTEQHPALLAQQASLLSSAAGVEVARWQYFPTPSVSVETVNAARSDFSYLGDERVTTLRLQQPVWAGGRLDAGVQKAESAWRQSQAVEKEVRRQLAIRAVQAYAEWLSSHLRLQVAQKSYETHAKLGAQVKRRAELGASAESDQSLVAVRMDAVSGEIAQFRGQMNAARSRLSQLMGRTVTDRELAAVSASPYSISMRQSEVDLLELAVANSPGVERARETERGAAATVAERQAELWPQVYIRLERQFGNFAIKHTEPATRYFIGLSSSVGAGLSSQSAIGGALAQRQAAQSEIDQQERVVREEVLIDLEQLSMLEERYTAIRSSINAGSQIVDSYLRQFLAGRKTWTDVMNAVREEAQYQTLGAEINASRILLTWRLAINTYGLAVVLDGENQ